MSAISQIHQPEVLASGCIVWIPISIWVLTLVGWMITAEVEVGQGLLGIAAAMVLGFFTLQPPHPEMAPLFALAAFATIFLAPVSRLVVHRSLTNQLEVEAIERAYELLSEKPENTGAKVKLARAAYGKGIRLHAIAIADAALKGQNERLFQEELRILSQWKAAEPGPPTPERIRCIECGIPNFPGAVFCDRCGAPFLLDYAKGRFVKSTVVRRVLAGWLVAVAALVGIPTAAVTLTPALAATVIVLLLVGGAWVLMGAFREPAAGRR